MPLDFFKRKLLVEAHRVLGNRRSKYSDMASAGGNIQLNGAALLETAAQMEEKLEVDVIQWKPPISVVIG